MLRYAAAALAAFTAVGALAANPPKPAAKPPTRAVAKAAPAKTKPAAEILAASPKGDWRTIDQANLMYIDLAQGQVIVELAPAFAPKHVTNIKTFAKEAYWDGASILRVQDNFVVQWGVPDETPKSEGSAKSGLEPEFVRTSVGLAFTPLASRDAYAAQVGFVDGFPAARNPATGMTWLAHCYGTVAIGRNNERTSGNGSELYAVIGPARALDRNLTVVGRVVRGMNLISGLHRGPGAMGFYEKPGDRTAIKRVRIGSDLPASERVPLEALRTDSKTFATLTEARRNRHDDFYTDPPGGVELCAVNLPVRDAK